MKFFKKLFKSNTGSKVITRMPPSPTGNLHVGTARTALFNYLFAKKNNGKMILRLEDTDKERSKAAFEENIVTGLQWLGITWDNDIIERQSERSEIYKKYLEKMIQEGTAYISDETLNQVQGDENKRSEVIRFKNPNTKITFTDLIRGDIAFDTTELEDFIIAKSVTEPLYNFTVVVDDHEMDITHVIRGEDGISNTPRQILIQEAIGAKRPIYAHLPLLLGKDKSKLSKRHGATAISDFRDKGYLSEAMINYLALLGWNPGTEQEIFSINELEKSFSLEKVQKGGAIFDTEKLDWFNKEHLKRLPKATLEAQISQKLNQKIEQEKLEKLVPIIIERIAKLSDIDALVEKGVGEMAFFFEAPDCPAEKLLWKKAEDLSEMKTHLQYAKEQFEHLSADDFSHDIIKAAIWDYASEEGGGNVLWPLRYALSGQDKSPDPFEIADILGKEETVARIETAIQKISSS